MPAYIMNIWGQQEGVLNILIIRGVVSASSLQARLTLLFGAENEEINLRQGSKRANAA
jgi:hypothetical protein